MLDREEREVAHMRLDGLTVQIVVVYGMKEVRAGEVDTTFRDVVITE
jgi:hypothetical protein